MSKEFKKVTGLVLAALLLYGTTTFASAASAPAKVKNVTVASVDEDELNLKWSKVSGATGYQVYVRSGSSGSWKKAETTTKNYAEVENLKNAHIYSVRVRAYTKSGGKVLYGSYSTVLKATTDPDEPLNVSIGATSNKKAKITWSAVPGADGYRVYKYNATAKKWEKVKTLTGTSYTAAVSAKGGDKFRVRAYTVFDGKRFYGDASDTVVSGVKAISYSKVKSIALKNAGLKESDVTGYEAEYGKEGKVYVYEVEFETKKYEYEYVINAESGKVIRKDVERR